METKTQTTDTISTSAYDVVHFFNIKVMDRKPGELIEFLSWSGLRWELRLKYNWYFKYRAALLQVKYPKYIVETFWGNEPAQGKTLEHIINAKIISKKATITKGKNKLENYKQEFERYKSQYSRLFPIEHEQEYKKYVASIDFAVKKINRLQAELNNLTAGARF